MFVLFLSFHRDAGQQITKEFQTFAAQYGDRMSFLIVDQDRFPAIIEDYGIYTMPYTVYFQSGTRMAGTINGNSKKYRDFITKYAPATQLPL